MKDIIRTTRLLDLREKNNLTQGEIAKIINVSQAQYSRIENDEYQLSYDGLIKLAKYYKTSVDYILNLTNEEKHYPWK